LRIPVHLHLYAGDGDGARALAGGRSRRRCHGSVWAVRPYSNTLILPYRHEHPHAAEGSHALGGGGHAGATSRPEYLQQTMYVSSNYSVSSYYYTDQSTHAGATQLRVVEGKKNGALSIFSFYLSP